MKGQSNPTVTPLLRIDYMIERAREASSSLNQRMLYLQDARLHLDRYIVVHKRTSQNEYDISLIEAKLSKAIEEAQTGKFN
ncbi:unnamed protein product [Bursaphelenchus okinawaensis]|uniref:Uncharacterized protein n=1 Tax=Bursaphelenchus okinawaensis TaxID=465554 RepID=A0A811L975_9BILA|nr:unnamed protein product [Bursaphelenchus okinawaensis]CAG9118534.1 unnamed protein product [Bursaphelenchus okinawaensis]